MDKTNKVQPVSNTEVSITDIKVMIADLYIENCVLKRNIKESCSRMDEIEKKLEKAITKK